MKIYVDADACPVVAIVEQIAKEYEIPVNRIAVNNKPAGTDLVFDRTALEVSALLLQ